MSERRLVVACRLPGAQRLIDRPEEVLSRFGALIDQAGMLGGTVVASGADTVVFAWDEAELEAAISVAASASHAPKGDEPAWACGVSAGEIHALPQRGPHRATLVWGEPVATAAALARIARRREIVVDPSLPAIVSHELLVNRTRTGRVAGRRLTGCRIDARQPWRAVAAVDIARMIDPPLIGRDDELARLMNASRVVILRADSGFGGSRMLTEVAAHSRPSRSITLTPLSAVNEPLGALRRAMAFVAATERITLPPELHPALDRLLGAQGVTLEEGGLLVAHQLRAREGAPLPSLLLDDVTDIDEPSIECCARAIANLAGAVRVVARIDAMSQLPRALARFYDGEEVTLGRFDGELAQELAGACTGGTLSARGRVQWARRGAGTPLGIVEAVAAGITRGELLFSNGGFVPLKSGPLSDVARPVGYWITRCAEALRPTSGDVLIALAHLGGEASIPDLVEVVGAVAPEIDLHAELVLLGRSRWIREPRPGTYALASRAQRESILELSRNGHGRDWRSAVARTLERAPGALRRAEAAHHAARAGQGQWASRLAMAAARAAANVGLEESASTLAAFAGVQNPGSSDLDLGALPIEDDVTVALPDARAGLGDIAPLEDDDGPKTVALPAPPSGALRPDYSPLLEAASELRESHWVEIARRALSGGAEPSVERGGLLALARAYAAAGLPAEALVHGLGALARMTEAHDGDGRRACLLFLAHLYDRTERKPEAESLRAAAHA